MPSIEVRPFRRADREQLTALVNTHVAAVVPGISVSVNTVMNQLEREPGEFIVDPWVTERATLIAEQRQRVVAAAHLLRYRSDVAVSDSYRDAGEIRWLLFWPAAPYWPDVDEAADALLACCVAQLQRWGVSRQYADGAVPAPGVYGIPAQWPHIRAALERAGFTHRGRVETIFISDVNALPAPGAPPVEGLTLMRSVGVNGTRLSAIIGDEAVGYIEVEILGASERLPRAGGWADIGNLHVTSEYQQQGIATWLMHETGAWLRLARVDRLLGYSCPEEDDCSGFFQKLGFLELTRTERGWMRPLTTNG
jgi:GNAT superfamily N-acetyltransferase